MRQFSSYTEALRYILPSKLDYDKLGTLLIEHYRKRILNNGTTGKELKSSTIKKKRERGAPSPQTKLYEGGGIMSQIKKVVEDAQLSVGYESETHRKFWPDDNDINVAKLVNVHHNHKTRPRRFLYIENEEVEIIRKWLSDVLRRKTA